MQAAIVAGGVGLRMRGLLGDLPKALLPMRGNPLVHYQLDWLKRSGVTEVFLCLRDKAEAVVAYCGDGSRWGLRVRPHIETQPRGTAGSVRDLLPYLTSDLLVVYGDLFIEIDCHRLLAFHASHRGWATVVTRITDHPMDSDLVCVKDSRITAIYRPAPGQVPSDRTACTAVWVVRPPLLELIPTDVPSDFAREIFPNALAAGGLLMAYPTEERIMDLGTPERLQRFLTSWEARAGSLVS